MRHHLRVGLQVSVEEGKHLWQCLNKLKPSELLGGGRGPGPILPEVAVHNSARGHRAHLIVTGAWSGAHSHFFPRATCLQLHGELSTVFGSSLLPQLRQLHLLYVSQQLRA